MEKWITVKKASELLNISARAIRIKANHQKIACRYVKGRGGRKMEILLSSLPDDAIARYHHLEPVRNEIKEMDGFSKKQKADANNKAWILELYHKRDKGMTVDGFVAWYNREHDEPVTKANIFQWQKKVKEGGTAALIDRRGEHKRGTTTIPGEAWEYFYSLYMSQEKRGVQLCYDWTKKEYPDIPSVYAFHRRVKMIPEYALVYYREGENAFRDCLPGHDRDKTDINSNDIWFSDHHRMDVFTKNEDGSRICRLWLTVFFDARSNKVISYICRNAAPDATVVKQTMRKGMEIHGIPKEVYFDNGKDYRSKAFRQDFPLSVVHQLGIGSVYATPYHGQAKTVERFFRTLEERFGRMFPTYTGKDAKNRPEQMRVSDEKILSYAVSIEAFRQCLDNYMEEYNRTPSRGKDMGGRCPDEVYFNNLVDKKVISDSKALAILCGTFETRTVQKNGITFKHREYWNEKLLPYFRKRVIINYVPENMDVLNVFDEEMRAICTAEAKIRTPFRNTDEKTYKMMEKQKRAARRQVRDAKPIQDIDIINLVSRQYLKEKDYKETGNTPAAAEQIIPALRMPAPEPKDVSTRIDPKEPSIEKILMKKYEEERRMIGG